VSESRIQLLARKRDLFDALRVLERDHADGAVDRDAYQRTRARYEFEAAAILERLDLLHARDDSTIRDRATSVVASRAAPWLAVTIIAVLAAAIGIFLAGSLHTRSTNQTITGAQPPAVPTPSRAPSAALLRAQRAVAAHPRDLNALLTLAQIYANRGDLAAAHRTYRTATRLAPDLAQAPTLDALVLAASGRSPEALQLLRTVERHHPRYARAWLTDGLIAERQPHSYARAINALRRFLRLMPRAAVAGEIRQAIAALQRSQRATR
jgi:cytochrome c-type biogenesis protein CcmH/NrfG